MLLKSLQCNEWVGFVPSGTFLFLIEQSVHKNCRSVSSPTGRTRLWIHAKNSQHFFPIKCLQRCNDELIIQSNYKIHCQSFWFLGVIFFFEKKYTTMVPGSNMWIFSDFYGSILNFFKMNCWFWPFKGKTTNRLIEKIIDTLIDDENNH